jgi:aldehyde:ferredoxin oxidoreductase
MHYGWKGKILRVDLEAKTTSVEDLPQEWAEKYMGCRGLNDIMLYNEVGPEVEPLSEDNKLFFSTGPLDGTPVGMGRLSVQTKHTKRFISEGGTGGDWGPELKFAGYDALVIEKKAETPVYVLIMDDRVEIRDAAKLWGLDTREKKSVIRDETGIPKMKVASIGQAGENLVSDSKVIFTQDHAGGRGCGTIMGAKKLAAIAVHGSGGVKIKNPEAFLGAYRDLKKFLHLRDTIDAFVPSWAFLSANMILQPFNENGWLHAFNAQRGCIENMLKPERYIMRYVTRPETGFCCPFPACGRRFEIKEGRYAGTSGDEREGGFAFCAPVVGITSWRTILKWREICARSGADQFMVVYTIAWAMECYEKGIITGKDTDGIDLRFGNDEAFIRMTEKIIAKEGFGELLARGSHEAARVIGKGSDRFLLTIKGRELELMPQRNGYQMALCLAVCENGPDHTRWYPPYPPNPRAIPKDIPMTFDPYKAFQLRSVEDKGRLVKWLYDSRAVFECLPTCVFIVRHILGIDMRPWLALYNACTGMNCSLEEFVRVGERVVNLERAYIVREGFRRKDDTVPRRMLEDPINERHIPPIGKNLDLMLDDYYRERGWNIQSAIPTEEKLRELDLDFVADEFRVNGIL